MLQSPISRRRALLATASFCVAGCSAEQNETDVTTGKKSDMNSVSESWKRIHDWLSANAPKIVENLNPPATEIELHDAEEALGIRIPSKWHDLYRGHNGMNSDANLGSVFHGMQFLTLEETISDHKQNAAPVDSRLPVVATDAEILTEDIHNPNWIAFAHDVGRTLIRVDMVPESPETIGQVIFTDHEYDTVILLSNGIAEFMSNFASNLEADRYFLNKEALAEGTSFSAATLRLTS
jgi:cell wall assembly regulator SMI1